MQHFRAAFEPIARAVVLVDTGALGSEIYTPSFSPRTAARFGRSTDP
jgi:microcystin degradation protein MlrC